MVICCFLGVLFHRAAAEGAVGYPALLSGWLLSEVSASDQFTQFAYIQVLQEGEAVFPPVSFEGKVRSWANEGEMAQPPTQWMWVPVVLQSKLIAALREKRREAAQGLAQCAGAIPKAAGGTAFPWVAAPLKHRQIQQVVFKPVQPHSSRSVSLARCVVSSCQLVPGGNTSRCPQETSQVSQEEGVRMIVEGLLLANIFLYWFDFVSLLRSSVSYHLNTNDKVWSLGVYNAYCVTTSEVSVSVMQLLKCLLVFLLMFPCAVLPGYLTLFIFMVPFKSVDLPIELISVLKMQYLPLYSYSD